MEYSIIFPHSIRMWGIFCRILSVPQNIVVDLKNVMGLLMDIISYFLSMEAYVFG